MLAVERVCSGRTWRLATEFTNPLMQGKRGRILDCETRSRLLRSLLIRRIRTAFSLLPWAILTARTPSAAFFARRTAARLSRRSYIRMKTRARPTWRSTRRIRRWSWPHWHRGRAERAKPYLCFRGSEQKRWRVCFEGCRGIMEADQWGPSYWRTRSWRDGNCRCARQSGRSLCHEHDDVEIDGWWENVRWLQGRARRR